jgi:TonB family protein
MNALLNYIIECNVALLFLLVAYQLFLRSETNFSAVRILMLVVMGAALLFPLVHIKDVSTVARIPSLSEVIPSYWLPEVIVGNFHGSNSTEAINPLEVWNYLAAIYLTGIAITGTVFLYRIFGLCRIIAKSKMLTEAKLKIIEVNQPLTFSFFNLVVIGNAERLSATEKQQIVNHESVHAKQWHSIDIIFINILSIIFWFNPFLRMFKKIFVQLHEFEADARAVEHSDVNNYCSLLARVALESAGFSIANHFNNSLTLKRIQMMRTIKSKMKWWKVAAFAAMIPSIFFFVACQDQITGNDELSNLPAAAQQKFESFKQNYPGETFIVEYDGKEDDALKKLDAKYGHAAHIELFTITENGQARNFSMIQYLAKATVQKSDSDTILDEVDEMPEPNGGMEGLVTFLRSNIRYPSSARTKGIQGVSMVSFVVEKDGSVSDVKILRGFDKDCDAESERVVKLMSNWKPGIQNGKYVRTRMNLPINYKL